jgi:DNA-binding MarR family transcriptional regulator
MSRSLRSKYRTPVRYHGGVGNGSGVGLGSGTAGAGAGSEVVDRMVEQWSRERPDLDLDAMETLALFSRFGAGAARRIDATFAAHGINVGEFDVLASLRRSGEPFRLSPGELATQLVLSASAMTNRLDRLEARDLVRRSPDPDDRRALLVSLTSAGRELVDAAVVDHVRTEEGLLAALGQRDRRTLTRLLRTLVDSLDAPTA